MTSASVSAPRQESSKPARKHLPRTGSELPLLALLGGLSLAGAFGVRLARRAAL